LAIDRRGGVVGNWGKSGGKLKAVSSWSAACKSDLELQPHFIHLAFLAFSTFWSNAKGEITIL